MARSRSPPDPLLQNFKDSIHSNWTNRKNLTAYKPSFMQKVSFGRNLSAYTWSCFSFFVRVEPDKYAIVRRLFAAQSTRHPPLQLSSG